MNFEDIEMMANLAPLAGDKAKEFVKDSFDRVWNPKVDMIDAATDNQKRMIKYGSRTATTVALFVAGTSMLDYARNRNKRKLANKENEEELKEQAKKNEKRSKAYHDVQKHYAPKSGFSYSKLNMGQTVFDLFDARSGHHKMGSSRFTQ